MVQLKFQSESGTPLGVISWYAVHATSMNNSNRLVSSDNMGYASVLFEQKMNPNSLIGKVSDIYKSPVLYPNIRDIFSFYLPYLVYDIMIPKIR